MRVDNPSITYSLKMTFFVEYLLVNGIILVLHAHTKTGHSPRVAIYPCETYGKSIFLDLLSRQNVEKLPITLAGGLNPAKWWIGELSDQPVCA